MENQTLKNDIESVIKLLKAKEDVSVGRERYFRNYLLERGERMFHIHLLKVSLKIYITIQRLWNVIQKYLGKSYFW